jgi:hypothetical protein
MGGHKDPMAKSEIRFDKAGTGLKAVAMRLIVAAVLNACSPAAPPPAPEPVPLAAGAMQTLVTAHAHLMGEAPRYGHATWERLADADGAVVFRLEPGVAPTITVKLREAQMVELSQQGVLTRQALAALAAAAGAPPGRHGPSAEAIDAALAKARTTGRDAVTVAEGIRYAASPSGDLVTAVPAER